MDFRKKPSGVVINTNKEGFLKAKKMKELIQKDRNRLSDLEERMNRQESILNEILTILKENKNG